MPEDTLATDLVDLISSAAPVPASGWVAGVTGALAASLVAKAAHRSDGWSNAEGARVQALDLRDRLLELAGQDARAYEHALTALERRDAGLARALARAAEAPLAIAEAAADAALLAAEGAERADGSARADAAAAACLASGAATAARRLVEANLATLSDDDRLARADRAAEAAADAAKRALAAEL
ncbi:MAG TPA: cyclodeaminase/cyclohydrolase family protein [Gaiellaceae bacterium]|nr:cyclodeaminase/cyclohydrolase family protein [Gaiellaceae bacterium]